MQLVEVYYRDGYVTDSSVPPRIGPRHKRHVIILPNWALTATFSLCYPIDVDRLVYERQKQFAFHNNLSG